MKLRNYILAGLGLCILTLLFSAFRSPDFASFLLRPSIPLALIVLVVLWNAYAAIYWTEPRSSEDSMVLNYGVKWGLAIGCAWAIVATVSLISKILPGVFVIVNSIAPKDPPGTPIGAAAALSGLLLPFVVGAAGAIKTRRVGFGTRVGFWSGVVSGLIGFHVVMAVGFATALIPGMPVFQTEDTLLAAMYIMFLFGTILGVVAGAVGGSIGLALYRTGEPRVDVASTVRS